MTLIQKCCSLSSFEWPVILYTISDFGYVVYFKCLQDIACHILLNIICNHTINAPNMFLKSAFLFITLFILQALGKLK